MCDVAVVGAGIAGLTAAWHLRHRDVVVLEAAARAAAGFAPRTARRVLAQPRRPRLSPPDSDLGRLVGAVGLETVSVPGTGMGAYLNGSLVTGRPATYPLRLRTSPAAVSRCCGPG
jgi:oxygen-dependent protoporphyrinogen oxidase